MTRHVLRYARWFAGALWPMDEIAELFDVAEEELRAALQTGGAAA